MPMTMDAAARFIRTLLPESNYWCLTAEISQHYRDDTKSALFAARFKFYAETIGGTLQSFDLQNLCEQVARRLKPGVSPDWDRFLEACRHLPTDLAAKLTEPSGP